MGLEALEGMLLIFVDCGACEALWGSFMIKGYIHQPNLTYFIDLLLSKIRSIVF